MLNKVMLVKKKKMLLISSCFICSLVVVGMHYFENKQITDKANHLSVSSPVNKNYNFSFHVFQW